MKLIRTPEHDIVRAFGALVVCNPFLPERVALEQQALGDAFVPVPAVWHAPGGTAGVNPNTPRLRELAERLGETLRDRLAAGATASAAELAEYHDLILSLLWLRYEDDWWALIHSGDAHRKRVSCYTRFARDVHYFFSLLPDIHVDPAHLFALGFQARRAFHHIFRRIFGSSRAAALLRAAVWESIFSDDVREYRRHLYKCMFEIPTLIIGEVGTGKELVARAIALSRYIPFNPRTLTFAADPEAVFCALNPSALSPTLIESELFGHCRGAFTGAVADRQGWLEACGEHGAVFLDEIGELEPAIQVKLLRVLQSREFHRVGEMKRRAFRGKLIAATHRDLEEQMQAGRFGVDLYDRICADVIRMPPLRVQLADAPDDLHHLVRIFAAQVAGPDGAAKLTGKVERWLEHVPPGYFWPGNVRQLEQCVRGLVAHSGYTLRRATTGGTTVLGRTAVAATDGAPVDPRGAASSHPPSCDDATPFLVEVRNGTLTADELLQGYCDHVQAQTANYRETARRLRLNWKTVRAKVEGWMRRPPS